MDAYNRLVNGGDMEAILEEAREERRKAREARGQTIHARSRAETDPRISRSKCRSPARMLQMTALLFRHPVKTPSIECLRVCAIWLPKPKAR